jgi:hypothetical protein
MQQLLLNESKLSADALALIELGLNHEQQHQELLLIDALHLLSCNPLLPTYDAHFKHASASHTDLHWLSFDEGLRSLGRAIDETGFAFDNESPAHQRFVQGFQIANRLVNCGEYLAFIQDGGYDNADLWLSEGRAQVLQNDWQCPLYWLAPNDPRAPSDQWQVFGLNGVHALDPLAPVANLSFYEASAYAQWAGARCPPSSNGKSPAVTPTCTTFTRKSGNGRALLTSPTPDLCRPAARCASTTANSWSASKCCAAAVWPPHLSTAATPTAIFSLHKRAGNSAACALPKIYKSLEHDRPRY